MTNCTHITQVRNKYGELVPSKLHSELNTFVTNHEEITNLFLYTQTESFKEWDPVTDEYGQASIYYNDGEPYYMNHKGDIQYVFKKGTVFKPMTSNNIKSDLKERNLIDNNGYISVIDDNREASINAINSLNKSYKRIYNLSSDLIYIVKKDDAEKVIVNNSVVNTINNLRKNKILSSKVNYSPSSYSEIENIDLATYNPKEVFVSYANAANKYLKELIKIEENTKDRLQVVNVNLKKNISVEEKKKLFTEKRILLDILYSTQESPGSISIEINKLKKEISSKKLSFDISDLSVFIENTLNMMTELSKSSNVKDLEQAQAIADFIYVLTDLSINNSIFSVTELANLTDDDKVSLRKWRIIADDVNEAISNKRYVNFINHIKNNSSLKATYGEKLSNEKIEELIGVNGLKDTHVIDMFGMDMSNGIFSKNGILPQIAIVEARNSESRAKAIIKEFTDVIDELAPKVEKIIEKLEGGRYKNKFGKGVSWEIFYDTDSGTLRSKYNYRWFDDFNARQREFRTSIKKIESSVNHANNFSEVSNRKNAIREKYRKWIKDNTIIVNFMNMPEVIEYVKASPLLSKLDFAQYKSEEKITPESLGITKKHYDEIVREQINMLETYAIDRESFIEHILGDKKELSNNAKRRLDSWEKENSPWVGFKNWKVDELTSDEFFSKTKYGTNVKIYNTFDHNVLIPKNKDLYWDSKFQFIEDNDTLYEFYKAAKKSSDFINDTQRFNDHSIITNSKNIYEILTDSSDATIVTRLLDVWTYLVDKLKEAISIIDSNTNVKTLTDLNNFKISKVNNQIINNSKKKIYRLFTNKAAEFVLLLDTPMVIQMHTRIDAKLLNTQAINKLANLLHCNNSLDDIRKTLNLKENDDIPVGRIIKNSVINQIISHNSFNLPRTLGAYVTMAAEYNGRTEIKPLLDSIFEYYKNIKEASTNNVNGLEYDEDGELILKSNIRTNAVKQFESWYKRVALGDYSGKHFIKMGSKKYTSEDKKIKKDAEEHIEKLTKRIEELKNEIRVLLDKEKKPSTATLAQISTLSKSISVNEQFINKLNNTIDGLGRQIYASSIIEGMLKFIRFKSLGWNLSSATTNLLEGTIANEIAIAQDPRFTDANWYLAKDIMKGIITKTNKDNEKKLSTLMGRFDILQDSKNEFQKSLAKTSFNQLEKINPYELNTSIEYINQSPLVILELLTRKIKDINGENEISIWDALNSDGKLLEQYRTDENVNNWENLNGDTYNTFKNQTVKLIVNTHGDYDELRGVMAKDTVFGKAGLMFKGWLPKAFYNRFATEQDDIELGLIGYKGRYRSYTSMGAAITGGIAGTLVLGMPGLLFGSAFAGGVASLNKLNHSFIGKTNGENTFADRLEEVLLYSKLLLKRSINFPISKVLNKKLDLDADTKLLMQKGFSAQDAANLQANMVEASYLLTLMLLQLLVKSFLWEEDDEEDDLRRQMHNLLMNRLMGLVSQSTMYVSIPEAIDTVTNVAFIKFVNNALTTVGDFNKFIDNDDIIKTGPYAGESRLLKSIRRTFLPTPFKIKFNDPISSVIGIESQMKTQFDESVFDSAFRSEEWKEKRTLKGIRAKLRKEIEIENPYWSKKKIEKEINKRVKELMIK